MKEENKGFRYTAVIILIAGIFLASYFMPSVIVNNVSPTQKEREWRLEKWGTLGSLDSAWSTGNTSILAIWVVNHSSVADIQFDTNDTAAALVNASNTVYGYAQKDDFYTEVPHSTALDLLIYVRANKTNAATGTTATDQFNDSWVLVNLTSADLGISGGVNLSGIVLTNVTDSAFIYMMFVFNGTQTGIKPIKGWNYAMCGTGFTLTRNQVCDDLDIDLMCFY